MSDPRRPASEAVEWPTLALIVVCHALWLLAVFRLAELSGMAAVAAVAVLAALHSSLTHEALHGHPTRWRAVNEALMALPLSLPFPYRRFRDLHLAHHRDSRLTDPHDDPESNYLDPAHWARLPGWLRAVYRANNTLAGRILLGPALSMLALVRSDLRLIREGAPGVAKAWALHGLGLLPVLWWLGGPAAMPGWLYGVAAYLGFGLLKIRTYLEHRAAEEPRARTVIVEGNGPLAFLFLNNSLHAVHHAHPRVPWYALRRLYASDPQKYRQRNGGYVYAGYGQIFRAHLLRAKDPVPHPLMAPPARQGARRPARRRGGGFSAARPRR